MKRSALVAIVAFVMSPSAANADQPKRAEPAPMKRVLVDRVVAVVGERFLLASEVDARVALFGKFADTPPEKRDARWNADAHTALVRLMIDETLLLRDLERRGITISDADVKRAMANAAQHSKRTEADLVAEATSKGLTREEYFGEIRRFVATDRWTREAVIPRLDPKIATDPKLFEAGVEVRRREILDELRRRTFIEVRQ